MTDEPKVVPRTLPDKVILVIHLVETSKGLRHRLEWKVAPTESQRYRAASLMELIARSLSPKWKVMSDKLDEAAVVGFKVDNLPPVIKKVLERWFAHEN